MVTLLFGTDGLPSCLLLGVALLFAVPDMTNWNCTSARQFIELQIVESNNLLRFS
ncbi:MAG: hypothetical protein KDD62_01690 [Bdellovibrionales bacterium]|nr:hypothetical protein [Bdellovibrionales bacterium]